MQNCGSLSERTSLDLIVNRLASQETDLFCRNIYHVVTSFLSIFKLENYTKKVRCQFALLYLTEILGQHPVADVHALKQNTVHYILVHSRTEPGAVEFQPYEVATYCQCAHRHNQA